jgi:hypothetical protein
MAREESDRDDLLREATGLVDRIQLRCPWHVEPIVVGFRTNGAVSLFIGDDEVYQFDSRSAWRRGYLDGRLLKAERGAVVELTRQRTASATTLCRRQLAADERRRYCERLARRLADLEATLLASADQVVGVVSGSGTDVRERVLGWLRARPNPIAIAQRPHVG